MAEPFAAPPINTLVSITPLTTPSPGRDALNVPPQLANLSAGTILEGFVVNRDGQSNPILRTPTLGDVMVKSDVFIKTGSEVVFRVDPTQQGAARIVSIDGMPVQDYAAALKARVMSTDTITQTATQPATQAAIAPQAAAPNARSAAVPLQAVLLNNAPLLPAAVLSNPILANAIAASLPVPAGLLKLQQGAQLEVRVLQVTLPAAMARITTPSPSTPPLPAAGSPTSPPPSALPAAASTPTAPPIITQPMANAATATMAQAAIPQPPLQPPAHPTVPQNTGASAPPPATAFPTPGHIPTTPPLAAPVAPPVVGNMATATPPPTPMPPLAASYPATPAQPLPTAPTPIPPPPSTPLAGIPAQVIGHEADGAMVLQTAMGTLKMHSPQKLPVGSTVQLQVQVQPPLTTAPATAPSTLSSDLQQVTTLAQHWPALEETVRLTETGAPLAPLARDMSQFMPTIGHKLTSGLLFFIAAAKGGDLRQWMGNRAVNALESTAPDLAARLKGDMLQLQQMLTDSPLQQWNSVMVPLMHEGALEQARLFFRQEHEQEPQKHDARKTVKEQRFIVEVDLSHMGEVQFDGFVRPGEKAKQFDLMVRSHAALPPELTQKIRATFENAMASTGMTGYLGFQNGQQHFVRPMARDDGQSGSQPILA